MAPPAPPCAECEQMENVLKSPYVEFGPGARVVLVAKLDAHRATHRKVA